MEDLSILCLEKHAHEVERVQNLVLCTENWNFNLFTVQLFSDVKCFVFVSVCFHKQKQKVMILFCST